MSTPSRSNAHPVDDADFREAIRAIDEQIDLITYVIRNRVIDPRKVAEHTHTLWRLHRARRWLATQTGAT